MDAFERVLADVMAGERTLYAREGYGEEAWRIVDPVLKADKPVCVRAPGSWGTTAADRVAPAERGCDPHPSKQGWTPQALDGRSEYFLHSRPSWDVDFF